MIIHYKSNVSKIAYYGVIQSAIFSALQNALFAWGLDEEDDVDEPGLNKSIDRSVNTMIDSQLISIGCLLYANYNGRKTCNLRGKPINESIDRNQQIEKIHLVFRDGFFLKNTTGIYNGGSGNISICFV